MKRILLKIAGKENFELDESISLSDVFLLCVKYGIMLIRGFLKTAFCKNISYKVFLGKNVKILKKKNVRIGKNTKIYDNVKIDALSTKGVTIGDNVTIGKNTDIECTGSLSHIGKGIEIGNNTSFASNCYFGCAGGIKIGSNVIAGQNIRFHSENHNYNDLNTLIKDQGVTNKGIIIGDNCWIGSGAVLLDGVEIGNGCVIAANAVITKSFPDNTIIGGVPAKMLKKRGE